MNILMLLFKDIHYDARVQREAIALAEAGHIVTIACLEEYTELPPLLHSNINLLRVPITTKRMRRTISSNGNKDNPSLWRALVFKFIRNPLVKIIKDILANREYYKKVKIFLDTVNISVIHCHDLNTLPAGYLLARKNNLKLVYDSHELFNEMVGKNLIEKRVGYWIENKLIQKINYLIVVNPYVEQEFKSRYGDIPTTVIQNTPILPHADLLQDEKDNYWRLTYNLEDTDIILLYQGGLTPERGIEECINALNVLSQSYKLVILGEGRIKEKLIKLTKDKNLEKRVFFHDQVPASDILWYTKQADIGLVMYKNTSKNNYLSTPNKIFEYMMAGIPTVASNHPGKRYLVEMERTGVCVDETPDSICKGIETVIERYNFYRKNCLEKRYNFSWQQEGTKMVDLYRKIGDER